MTIAERESSSVEPQSLDFDLTCEVIGDAYFSIVRSPAGEAREGIALPMDELEQLHAEFEQALARPGEVLRGAPSCSDIAQDLGRRLFRLFFVGEVLQRYDVTRNMAQASGSPLRIRIRTTDPRLTGLPWELLYDDRSHLHLALSATSPLIRYIEIPEPIVPLEAPKPIRVLGVVANPPDQPQLQVKDERQRVENALRKLIADKQVELEWLPVDTWRALQHGLRRRAWHVLHFIGHGAIIQGSEGALAFTSDDRRSTHWLRASTLANLVSAQRFSLVILNSCDGARSSMRQAFKSSAAVLVRRGVPAVVAMQHKVRDRAAIEFARSFYEAAAEGLPIEGAVTAARIAVEASFKEATGDWATPVLFMRAGDGHLFPSAGARSQASAGTEASPRSGRVRAPDRQAIAPSDESGRRSIVIAVMGTRGGVGKGTVVGCFAQLFAEAGRTVCVLDLDLAHYGTTRDATRRNRHELGRVRSAFDHFASHAAGFENHAGPKDEQLLDVTPEYLKKRNLGQIWLIPATDTLTDGSFDVVANIHAPREDTIFSVIDELIERAQRQVEAAEVIVVDCGAGKDPTYSAAFARADYGYIVGSPDATTVTEVVKIKREHRRRFPQARTRVFTIVNRVTSEADKQRTSECRPVTYVPRDPLLEQDSFRAPVDYDIGYDDVFAALHLGLTNSIAQHDAGLVPDEIDVRIRPWWNRLIETQAAARALRSWELRLLAWGSVTAAIVFAFAGAWNLYLAFDGEHVSVWRLAGALASAAAASTGAAGVRSFLSRRRLLRDMVALAQRPNTDGALILDELMAKGRRHLRWLNGISNAQQARVRKERNLAGADEEEPEPVEAP